MPKGQYTRKPRAEAEMPATPIVPPIDAMPVQVTALDPVPPAEPDHESFDDWMDQPVPTAPNDTMVGQKVRTWAGSVCGISHGVTWAPVNDGSALEVVLTTIHGTARMRKPVGQWTEADVDFALEAMRDDLKV